MPEVGGGLVDAALDYGLTEIAVQLIAVLAVARKGGQEPLEG
jgi:hypothetical protein